MKQTSVISASAYMPEGYTVLFIRIRYDETFITLNLDDKDVGELWVSLGLEDKDDLPENEKQKRLQDAFDTEFNKPERNAFATGNYKISDCLAITDKEGERLILEEPLMEMTSDKDVYSDYDAAKVFDREEAYRECCDKIRSALRKKPHWAEAFIAVRIDEMAVKDYAASIGEKDASKITHWLTRAEKALKEKLSGNFQKTVSFPSSSSVIDGGPDNSDGLTASETEKSGDEE